MSKLVVILIVIGMFAGIGYWTDGNLEWVLTEYTDESYIDKIPYWASLIVTILANGFIVIFNVICEILQIV